MQDMTGDDSQDPLAPLLERLIAGLPAEWAERARRFRAREEVPIGELGAHPDLGERLEEVTRQLEGAEFGVYYRMFTVRDRRARIFACAQGTNTIRFRVGRDRAGAIARADVVPEPDWGADWVQVNEWNPQVPTREWLAALEDLARRAHEFAGSEP